MKYAKKCGLVTVVALALMAFVNASTASATEATCSKGVMCTNGSAFEARATHLVLKGAVEITCEESVIRGEQANTGSSTETDEYFALLITITVCKNGWITTTIKPGKLIFHTDEQDPTGTSGNATVTWAGGEITAENKSLGGLHCIFTTTTPTDIGTLDGSTTTGKTATLTVEGTITRSGGRSGAFCGSSAVWTGDYTVLVPDFLDIH